MDLAQRAKDVEVLGRLALACAVYSILSLHVLIQDDIPEQLFQSQACTRPIPTPLARPYSLVLLAIRMCQLGHSSEFLPLRKLLTLLASYRFPVTSQYAGAHSASVVTFKSSG